MPDPPRMSIVPLERVRRAALDRLNNHVGRMALADYEKHRWAIEQASDDGAVRAALREATGEEIGL